MALVWSCLEINNIINNNNNKINNNNNKINNNNSKITNNNNEINNNTILNRSTIITQKPTSY